MSDVIFVDLVDRPIDYNALSQRVADPDVGAHGWFFGVTRRTTSSPELGHLVTQSLSYEAHESMARNELMKLATAASERFDLTRIVIVHRLGDVPVGEASVVVGCSSSHRPATFEALPWIMNCLKRDVPIWKCEKYADQTSRWVHPSAERESDDSR